MAEPGLALRAPVPWLFPMAGRGPVSRDAQTGKVVALVSSSDEAQLLAELRAGHQNARVAFFRRYHHYVERLLVRTIGFDAEIPDLVQEVFLAALKGVPRFRGDHNALSTWLGQITIRTAQLLIRKRKALRWLDFRPGATIDEARAAPVRPELRLEDRQVLERTYAALDKLPTNERMVFVLRYIDGMEVTEVAELCQISLATVKRRSKAAWERFLRLVGRDPVLREWRAGRGEDSGEGHA